jgi:hypothetical protein
MSFATLPDHWKLTHYLDQQNHRLSADLLLSGDLENLRSASQEGWSLVASSRTSYSSTADIIQDPRAGRILRLIAWQSNPQSGRSSRDDSMPLMVSTPGFSADKGDVMVVSGRIRRGRTTSIESKRPLIIFDSELGPESSIRTKLDSEWTRFEMIRPIGAPTEFSVTLGLIGQADVEEVHVDDLTIQKLPALSGAGSIRFTGNVKSLQDSISIPNSGNPK